MRSSTGRQVRVNKGPPPQEDEEVGWGIMLGHTGSPPFPSGEALRPGLPMAIIGRRAALLDLASLTQYIRA